MLTHLPNRVLLADRLRQAMAQSVRRAEKLVLVFIDLDGFKLINDTHGHATGDKLLIALASRMSSTLREGDTLARIGGDEFVAVLIDLSTPSSAHPVLERMRLAAAQPFLIDGLELQVSASLGVVFYPQQTEMDAEQLLRQADQAMYQAKVAGKNRYHVFDTGSCQAICRQKRSAQRGFLGIGAGSGVSGLR
jgi:diguanylate cyclase (GGDEF)-like protein